MRSKLRCKALPAPLTKGCVDPYQQTVTQHREGTKEQHLHVRAAEGG